jgi:hypothetical protein
VHPWFQLGRYFAHTWVLFAVVCLRGFDLDRTGWRAASLVLAALLVLGFALPETALLYAFDWSVRAPFDVTDVRTVVAGFGVVAAIAAVWGLARGAVPRPPWWAIALWLGPAVALGAIRHGKNVRDTFVLNVAMARAIPGVVPVGERIATHDIGAIGYFSGRPILDLAGLGSPEVTFRPRGADGALDVAALLAELRPRWLCLTSEQAAMLNPGGATIPGVAGARPRKVIEHRGNVTVAGDAYYLIELSWE